MDFFQASMGERMGIDIAGMVGMEFLEQVDIEMDPFNHLCTIYEPGEPYIVCPTSTLCPYPRPPSPLGLIPTPYPCFPDSAAPARPDCTRVASYGCTRWGLGGGGLLKCRR